MNSAHIAATGGLTAALAQVIQWHGSGPVDTATATALAGLIMACLGWFATRFPKFSNSKGQTA